MATYDFDENNKVDSNRTLLAAQRICFFCHFDIDDLIDDYVLYYLEELQRAGFCTVFVTTSHPSPAETAKLGNLTVDLIVRPNQGLDFGGWADCLAKYPDISPDYLLLTNDSVYGPFWSLDKVLLGLTSKDADFYGMVHVPGEEPHLQSWFLLLRPEAYRSLAFRRIMGSPVPPAMTKYEIIKVYEKGLTRDLISEGLRYASAFDYLNYGPLMSRGFFNPSLLLWQELLTRRIVPFLKVQAVRERALWGKQVRRWHQSIRYLNPKLADLALTNLKRRERHASRSKYSHAREKLNLLAGLGCEIPMLRELIVRDLDKGALDRHTGKGRWRLALYVSGIYVHRLLQWPYRKIHQNIGSRRRRVT